MQNCSPVSMLMIEAKLKKALNSYICEPQMLKDYQKLLGEIMHLMIKICPDLAFFFQLAKFNTNATNKHWKALKKYYTICKE